MQSGLSNLNVKQKEQAIGLRKYIAVFAIIITVRPPNEELRSSRCPLSNLEGNYGLDADTTPPNRFSNLGYRIDPFGLVLLQGLR